MYTPGLFCREADSLPVIHYHCPCCIKHSETTIQEIEQHYRHCVSTMSNQNALFTSICKHDEYITFQVIIMIHVCLFVGLFVAGRDWRRFFIFALVGINRYLKR